MNMHDVMAYFIFELIDNQEQHSPDWAAVRERLANTWEGLNTPEGEGEYDLKMATVDAIIRSLQNHN